MDETTGYLSIIGVNYLYPLTGLIEILNGTEYKKPNRVQSSPLENGHSAAIIVLSILFLESAFVRVKHILKLEPRMKPHEVLKALKIKSNIRKRVIELFVVRDVIVHNHLWNAQVIWNENLDLHLISTFLEDGGDNKFKSVIDWENRKTRLLRLNLFPTRINRADAFRTIKYVIKIFLLLEKIDRNLFYLSPQLVLYRKTHVNFIELVNSLRNYRSN